MNTLNQKSEKLNALKMSKISKNEMNHILGGQQAALKISVTISAFALAKKEDKDSD